ncbi:AraC family transcriptional regulator N-terminal domain-containing protein [Gallaecimonas pentaromativorans]|uniref:AraC family transcriptional regulator n=1 Tax=Gallaecimonas pentaromativorans TaxID=584787 RepID=UPI003A92991E
MPSPSLAALATALSQKLERDGETATAYGGLKLYRYSGKVAPMPCLYIFGLGITVQGSKRLMAGEDVYLASAGQLMITSADLPVINNIIPASDNSPYLGIWLDLDMQLIAQLALAMDAGKDGGYCQSMKILDLEDDIADALSRLLAILDQPVLLAQLAPLIQQEIVVRLLLGPGGWTLRQLVSAGSPINRVAKVVSWLRLNFSRNLPVDELAAMANMSPSSFRQHFRAVTGMSPLQYLKRYRLLEARQLLLNHELDAASAALRVGYESPSQFSREYTRLFGAPPLRDVRRLKSVVAAS